MTNKELLERTTSCIGGLAGYIASKTGRVSDLYAHMYHTDKAFDDMLPIFEVRLNNKGCVVVRVTDKDYSLYLHIYHDNEENDVLIAQSSSRNYIYRRIYSLMQIV